MGDLIADVNVYGEDAAGRRRLLYVAGDRIPEEEAKRLGVAGKAKTKAEDKAEKPPADKAAGVVSTARKRS